MTHTQKWQNIVLIPILLLTVWTQSTAGDEADTKPSEKEIEVAMRMIGHELLLSLDDCDSRVLPIEKQDEIYRIAFEREFEFDPDALINISGRVMEETGASSAYLIEVQDCRSKETVHSFVGGEHVNQHMIACRGRGLPKSCYELMVTLLDEKMMANLDDAGIEDLTKTSRLDLTYLIIPLILIFGVFYLFQKRKNEAGDSHEVQIGSSLFDKRKMILSFKNQKVELSNKEAELLSVLHSSVNQSLEREEILKRVWGDEGAYVGRTLDVFISKLRKKLEEDTRVKIANIRGVGYKLIVD